MHTGERAGADLPEYVAFEIISGDEHFVAVEEAQVNPLAVGGGCRGCMAVEIVDPLEWGDEDDFLIGDFAVCPVESEQQPLRALLDGRDEENSVFPDYWGCVPFARQRRLPEDILRIAPFDGDVFLDACAVSSGASPCGPILGFGETREGKDENQQQERDDEFSVAARHPPLGGGCHPAGDTGGGLCSDPGWDSLIVSYGIGGILNHFAPRLVRLFFDRSVPATRANYRPLFQLFDDG